MSENEQPKMWLITYCSVCDVEMMAGADEKPPVCMDCAAKQREATRD